MTKIECRYKQCGWGSKKRAGWYWQFPGGKLERRLSEPLLRAALGKEPDRERVYVIGLYGASIVDALRPLDTVAKISPGLE